MIFAIATFLVNRFGLEFETAKKWTRRGLIAAVFCVVFLALLGISRCGDGVPEFKLDEAAIQRGERAIKEKNRYELEKILIDAEVREKDIDANLAKGRTETVNTVADAKKRYAEMTDAELAAEFEKRK